VQRERLLHRTTARLEHALLQHVPRAVLTLLTRLEHEHDLAGQRLPPRVQHAGSGHEHRRVGVVAARVHRPVDLRGEREPALLLQRQRVHVAAQQHGRARLLAVQHRRHRTARLARADVQTETLQRVQHRGLRLRQVEALLGVLVELPAQ
jgi:hypothetical protein